MHKVGVSRRSPDHGVETVRRADTKTTRQLIVIAFVVSGLCGLGACGDQTSQSSDPAPPTADTVSTREYLGARIAREEAVKRKLASSQATVERYVEGADMRCPGIAAKAPRSTEFDELNHDALVAVGLIMEQGNAAAMTQFDKVTQGLRWGRTSLTLLVRRLAREEHALARVGPLDICAVLRDWAQSGFRAIPATVTRFQRQIRAFASRAATRCRRVPPTGRSICSLGRPGKPTAEEIGQLLKQYEDGRQREIARETEQIENRLATRTRATLIAATSTLTQHLGLDPFALRLFVASLKEL